METSLHLNSQLLQLRSLAEILPEILKTTEQINLLVKVGGDVVTELLE